MTEKPLYHYHTPIRMAKIEQTIPSAGEDAEQWEFSQVARGNVKWYNHYGKWFSHFKLNIHLAYNPATNHMPRC